MTAEFTIQVRRTGDSGTLEWSGATDLPTLSNAVQTAAEDSLNLQGIRRLEVSVPAFDSMARRALHRSSFRCEGRRRSAMQVENGDWVDVWIYSRLANDPQHADGGFSAVMDTVLPTKRTIGHVVMCDEASRLLLMQTRYKSDWELPGGIVEPGESPRIGAEREVLEETGLVVALTKPVLVDWMPPHLGWSDAVEFIFDAGILSAEQVAAIRPADDEIAAIHWVEPTDVALHVTELSARRIELVLGGGGTHFTEDGFELE